MEQRRNYYLTRGDPGRVGVLNFFLLDLELGGMVDQNPSTVHLFIFDGIFTFDSFVRWMGTLNLVIPMVIFDESGPIPAKGFSFTLFSFHIHHSYITTHTLVLDIFSDLQITHHPAV